MNEPVIRYCAQGHIYDASVHAQCPYCEKILQNQRKLASELSFGMQTDYAEETELLRDETELLQHAPDRYEDATEQLREASESVRSGPHSPESAAENDGKEGFTAGWLVCLQGPERGQSFTVLCSPCFLAQGQEESLAVLPVSGDAASTHPFFFKRGSGSVFLRNMTEVPCYMDGQRIFGAAEMPSGARIEVYGRVFIFVPLPGGLFDWE